MNSTRHSSGKWFLSRRRVNCYLFLRHTEGRFATEGILEASSRRERADIPHTTVGRQAPEQHTPGTLLGPSLTPLGVKAGSACLQVDLPGQLRTPVLGHTLHPLLSVSTLGHLRAVDASIGNVSQCLAVTRVGCHLRECTQQLRKVAASHWQKHILPGTGTYFVRGNGISGDLSFPNL